jgi:FMN phosphatase YigB (HAD superfamily)
MLASLHDAQSVFFVLEVTAPSKLHACPRKIPGSAAASFLQCASPPFWLEELWNMSSKIAFLLDVDNTLIDNDSIIGDLKRHLAKEFTPDHQEHYWRIFDEHRAKYGFADYLGTLQRYRTEHECDPHFIKISLFLLEYPFADRLFPSSLKVIEHLGRQGTTIVYSEGDAVFQPHKVKCSGLYDAVEGRVLIYVKKNCRLDDVRKHYPAEHYVVVDDRLEILTELKKGSGGQITTIFVRQGHHARAKNVASLPPADATVESIGELLTFDRSASCLRDVFRAGQ